MRLVERNRVGAIHLHSRRRSLADQSLESNIQRKGGASASESTNVNVDTVARALSVELAIHEAHLEVASLDSQCICSACGPEDNHLVEFEPLADRTEIVVGTLQVHADACKSLEMNIVQGRIPQTGVDQRAGIQKDSILSGVSRSSLNAEAGKHNVGSRRVVR